MIKRVCVLSLALVGLMACGDDDNPTPDAGGDQDSGGGDSCPNIAGTWTIDVHCAAPLIGTTLPVTQTGCSFTTGGAFPGFTGTLDEGGDFTMSGVANGTTIDCSGTATNTSIEQTCTGDCDVALSR